MKILFLLRSSILNNVGGAEVQANYLAQALSENGHEVHYLFDSNEKHDYGGDILYHNLKDRGNSFSWMNFRSIKGYIDRIQPDIIYQRCRSAYTGIAAYYSRSSSVKMVLSVASLSDCERNSVNFGKNIFNLSLKEYLGRYGVKNVDCIIVQSKEQKKLIETNFNRNSIQVNNGHPVPEPPFNKSTPPIVSWISNIKEWKQPEVFIRLAKDLHDTDVQFVFAGRMGNSQYQNKIMRLTDKMENIQYLGPLSFDGANDLLARSSIFINTSLRREGFPNTYIQAWMRETPVVTLNFDPDDLLKIEKIGFHSSRYKQFVDDVRFLLVNKKERHLMGKRARQYAINNHDHNKIWRRHREILENLIDR